MFGRLGISIARHPILWIVGWIVFIAVLARCAPDMGELVRSEPDTLLPLNAPSNKAFEFLLEAFPQSASRSQIIVVIYRPTGLTDADGAYMHDFSLRLVEENKHRLDEHPKADTWRILSPYLQPLLTGKLISRDKQMGLIMLNLSVNFVTMRAKQAVETVERLSQQGRPEGLTVYLTGSAGVGRDYAVVAKKALDKTMWVTVVAVMVILAVVYRSPLAAAVPLFSISLSVYGAFQVLNLLAWAGLSVSSIEKMFTVVLLFGAGTDYALFWIARYREELLSHVEAETAVSRTMAAVGPAIVASAATIIFGLAMLVASDFVLSHNAGQVLGPVLVLALAASLTLAPALAVLMGRRLFWPARLASRGVIGQQNIWPRLAKGVVARPGLVLICSLAIMAIPIWTAWHMKFRYDTIAELPSACPSMQGANLAQKHFPPGEAFVTTFVVEHPRLVDLTVAKELSEKLTTALASISPVSDVRSLTEPFGLEKDLRERGRLLLRAVPAQVAKEYLSNHGHALRIDMVMNSPPFVDPAFDAVTESIRRLTEITDKALGKGARVLASGLTPYMIDIRTYSISDHRRVTTLVVAVILLIVVALTRDVPLSIFMLAATLVTYLATLGICEWVFVGLIGQAGVDWKARVFLFVIIVAVGQDYNIFLVTRLFQEGEQFGHAEAAERAIVRTGSIISSCGVIMASTLGSLMASGLKLMEQLGFAMSAGILIDTFLVRPLLIPAFHLLRLRFRRAGK
jgi:RND superfamily putative drug exporter